MVLWCKNDESLWNVFKLNIEQIKRVKRTLLKSLDNKMRPRYVYLELKIYERGVFMNKESVNKQDEDLSLKLFVVLTRAIQSVKKKVEEDIKGMGLNPTEFAVLELVYNKGDQPIQKIGEKVLIASSSITYVVDKLEKKELLKEYHRQKIADYLCGDNGKRNTIYG